MIFLEPGYIATIKHCCVAHLYDLFNIQQCTNLSGEKHYDKTKQTGS